jgi:DNA-binding PadR family transcriptional regulator
MKRDKELARELLLQIEAATGKPSFKELTPESEEAETSRILEHLKLLEEAGFIRGTVINIHGFRLPQNIELTCKGHEFLDDVRDPDVWRKTKEKTKGLADLGLSLLWEIAKSEVMAKLGLP